MKKFFLGLLILVSIDVFGQVTAPSGYDPLNSKYWWLGGGFDALHLPYGTGLKSGQSTRAGAVMFDSSTKKLRIYDGSILRQYQDSTYRLNDSTIVVRYGTQKDTLHINGKSGETSAGNGNTDSSGRVIWGGNIYKNTEVAIESAGVTTVGIRYDGSDQFGLHLRTANATLGTSSGIGDFINVDKAAHNIQIEANGNDVLNTSSTGITVGAPSTTTVIGATASSHVAKITIANLGTSSDAIGLDAPVITFGQLPSPLTTADRLMGIRNSTGQAGKVSIGTGLSLSSGVLSATGAVITANNGLTDSSNRIILGGTLYKATTIATGGNSLSFTGTGVISSEGDIRIKPSYTSSWITGLPTVGNGTSAEGAINLREWSTGGGNIVTLSPATDIGSSDITLRLYGNDEDTLATRAYARSAGGGSTTPAGNYGNLQINRNSVFSTPASDSLDFESATGLTVKGQGNFSNLADVSSNIKGTASKNALIIRNNYTVGGNWNPGIVWANPDDNATIPKGGIFFETSGSGSLMHFLASNNYGATPSKEFLKGDYNGDATAGRYLVTTGTTSGNVSIGSATGTYNFILPTTSGTSGYFLTSAAGGTTTWTDPTSLGYIKLTGTNTATGNMYLNLGAGTYNFGIDKSSPTSTFHLGGSFAAPYTYVNANNYTATATDYVISVDNQSGLTWTLNIPDAATCIGRVYIIKFYDKNSNGDISILPASNNIQLLNFSFSSPLVLNGAGGYAVSKPASVTIQSNGTDWEIIGESIGQ